MAQKLNEREIISKASKAYIKDYYAEDNESNKAQKGLLRPTHSFYDLLDLMKDSTFNTEVNVLVDALMKEGYKVVKKSDVSKRDIKKEDKLNQDFRFYRLLRSIYLNLLVYRNSFVEIEFKGRKPFDLHLLETTEMNINVTPHGEIIGYTQIHESGPVNLFTGKKQNSTEVFFEPEECIHLSPSRITTNPWGFVDTRSIKNIVQAKQYLENYITDLFAQNKFRDLFVIKNASSKDQVKNFIHALKQGKIYTDKDIVVEGEIEHKQIRDMKDFEYILKLHENYKAMIREFLRVPPLMVGDTGSNKSTGEFEVRYAFDNTVRSWQKIVEDEINNELFPKLGWNDYMLVHFPIDKPSEKNAIEMAVQLKGLGYDDNTIHKYLIIKGVQLPEDAKIQAVIDLSEEGDSEDESDDNAILEQTLQNKNAPSRKPRDKSVDNANTMEKKETRQEQIIGKASHLDFGSYPYVF